MTQLPRYLTDLRPSQLEIIQEYNGGRMGISAVPGSGKTYTLSTLAADIILSGDLDLDQEILIVTLSNSAVDNFSQRISAIIESQGLLPGMGYRVRTLHGLAHDIVRERPSLVNLANDFTIIDEREANAIREGAALAWLRANPGFIDDYLNPDLSEYQAEGVRTRDLPRMVQNIALSAIRYAKDRELTPADLQTHLAGLPAPLPLAEMACEIYHEYQRSLAYRGAVDFDDLIRLALAALRKDPALVRRLRQQWPFILEDEAQDSSLLQQKILETLAGEAGNWVRVGDPNQAIYETFTTADPKHLIDFIHQPNVLHKDLPVSGRSTAAIIAVANRLIDWTRAAHPLPEVRDALHLPHILPTGPNDPQSNPTDDPKQVYFSSRKMPPAEELELVISHLVKWHTAQLALDPDARETLAVLDLRNERGAHLADELRKRGIEPVELLGTTTPTRLSAGALTHILRCLANPQSASQLAKAFNVWRRRGERNQAANGDEEAADSRPLSKRAVEQFKKLKQVEDYLYPLPDRDWLESLGLAESDPEVYQLLSEFRVLACRWQSAALLPIDQVILTLSQDLFTQPADLAIAHKLAAALRQAADTHPAWRLPELSEELETIAKNKRRFIGFSEDDSGFDPSRYKGRVIITTMHKAKGLEWDRVYLLSLNNYDYPSGTGYDQYYGEKWFIRGKLNLEAETLEQIRVTLSQDEYDWYEEGRATQSARNDCIRERLRLLYVGITRAKKALVATWNTGRSGEQQPALPFLELQDFWQKELYPKNG